MIFRVFCTFVGWSCEISYNLNNVKLSFTDAQGNAIDLGVIETIPKHSKIVLPGEAFDSLKEAFDKID
ncbi:hypothetical protein JT068_02400, partial [Helicobacter pylori]|nr:hypothetical protein [Helicobacter pylori]